MATWPQVSIETDRDYSLCFCCGRDNPIGLKLSFDWDGTTARAEFTPTELYQGWRGLIHGGIIVSLLDEAMTYAALFEGQVCVTAGIQARLRRPVSVNESLVVTASVTRKTKKLFASQATLSLKDGTIVAEGTATQFVARSASGLVNPETMSRNSRIAVIWDLDGVILDTASYHFKSWQETFGKRGIKFTGADFRRGFGQRNEAIIPSIAGRAISQAEIAKITGEKESIFRHLIKNKVKPFPGAIKLITQLAEKDIKMALVSSTPMENIQLFLTDLNIFSHFRTIIAAEDVTEGKPSPQGFLAAAQRLGVKPENCVVIEDSVAGVAAAKKAGMHCVAVTTTHPKSRLKEADLVVGSLEKLTTEQLVKLAKP